MIRIGAEYEAVKTVAKFVLCPLTGSHCCFGRVSELISASSTGNFSLMMCHDYDDVFSTFELYYCLKLVEVYCFVGLCVRLMYL